MTEEKEEYRTHDTLPRINFDGETGMGIISLPSSTALPFVCIDNVIIYLHKYAGFKFNEWFFDAEWEYTIIEGKRDGEWDSLGLTYGESGWHGSYDRETAKAKAQAAIDTIRAALDQWNERCMLK